MKNPMTLGTVRSDVQAQRKHPRRRVYSSCTIPPLHDMYSEDKNGIDKARYKEVTYIHVICIILWPPPFSHTDT